MGGSDPENITIKVLESIDQTNLEISLKIIIGRMTQIKNSEIHKVLKHYKGEYIIYKDVDNMGQLMSSSDLAVISSGLTKYETAFMGLPSIVIALNNIHTEINDAFATHGSIVNLGTFSRLNHGAIAEAIISLTSDFQKRSKMSEAGRRLIDGKALERIYNEIFNELAYA
jgi:spore coat polysaccharide biosynthesis predicted glycosyltransferase SpsG